MPRAARFPARGAAFVALALAGCVPDAPAQTAGMECEEPPSTVPSEVASEPNVNIVIVDRTHPQILDASEVIMWDGWLAHQARAHTFFCHRPERTVLALEAAPGPHKLNVRIQFFGSPGSSYDQLNFDLKSDHEVDVPEDGIVVVNLELSLGAPRPSQSGTEVRSPQLHYREEVLPVRASK